MNKCICIDDNLVYLTRSSLLCEITVGGVYGYKYFFKKYIRIYMKFGNKENWIDIHDFGFNLYFVDFDEWRNKRILEVLDEDL